MIFIMCIFYLRKKILCNIISNKIIKMHECKICKFYSDRPHDFNRHLISKKHIINEYKHSRGEPNSDTDDDTCVAPDLPYKCICEYECKTRQTLWRHKKMCDVAIEYEMLNNTKKPKKKKQSNIKNLIVDMKNSQTEIEILKSELQLLRSQQSEKSLTNNSNNNINSNNTNIFNDNKTFSDNKTINVFTYVNSNYLNVEPLKPLEQKQLKKMLTIDSRKNGGHCFCDFVVFHYEKHLLHEYLGDIIINAYLKKDPEEQQFWSSDVARLSFIVRRVLDQDDLIWLTDKKGSYIEKTIISPLLDELKLIMQDYKNKCREKMETIEISTKDIEKYTNAGFTLSKVNLDIDLKQLHPKILTYITPHFQLRIKNT